MPGISARSRRQGTNYWPGFVDALAALLMVVVFLIMIFALAQVFLSDALSDRGAALDRLTRQVDELSQLLDLERGANADLRLSVAQLSAELQSSLVDRDSLSGRLSGLIDQNEVMLSDVQALDRRLATTQSDLAATQTARDKALDDAETVRAELIDAFTVISADKETIEVQLRNLESLERDLTALRTVRDDLETQVTALAETLGLSQDELQQTRDRTKALEARLVDEQERTSLAQKELDIRDIRLAELLQRAEGAEAVSSEAQTQVELLNSQLLQLRIQITALSEILEATEAKNEEQQTEIVDLGRRLNQALAFKVQELAEYRSEFFGRLRQVLGERDDMRIVGDRFVFQSEVLFPSAAAQLEPGGQDELGQFAATLRDLSADIPDDIDWVLRVDGHTDVRPIRTAAFPSNWELSSARALSVVRFLIDRGIPADRLVAAGFGQFHPLDEGLGEIAFRRNRRIEFKLTQR